MDVGNHVDLGGNSSSAIYQLCTSASPFVFVVEIKSDNKGKIFNIQ